MFDFTDVTGLKSVLKNLFNFCSFCPLTIVIKEVYKKGLFSQEKTGNTNGIIFTFKSGISTLM